MEIPLTSLKEGGVEMSERRSAKRWTGRMQQGFKVPTFLCCLYYVRLTQETPSEHAGVLEDHLPILRGFLCGWIIDLTQSPWRFLSTSKENNTNKSLHQRSIFPWSLSKSSSMSEPFPTIACSNSTPINPSFSSQPTPPRPRNSTKCSTT